MHEHLTDAALRVLEWAYFEANALCAATTRPEHLLIGLAVEPGTFLRRVMDSREIQISELRRAVAEAGLQNS
jgi:ATP-dependent Clp protease ATP-binding subunit ClpA